MTSWVLLRGLTRESRHWGGFVRTFGEHAPGARVIALDLPGNGRSHRLRSPATVSEMAAYCREQLRQQGATPPYHLLAMSLGAMVAVDWASSHADEIGGCVLINTSLYPFSPFYQRLCPRNYASLIGLLLRPGDHEACEATVLRLTTRHPPQRAALLSQWVAWRRECPVSRRNAARQLLCAARYRAPSDRPRVPLLILASTHDGLVDVRCSRELARRWRCDIAEHASAGHDLVLDDATWVAERVCEWRGRQEGEPVQRMTA